MLPIKALEQEIQVLRTAFLPLSHLDCLRISALGISETCITMKKGHDFLMETIKSGHKHHQSAQCHLRQDNFQPAPQSAPNHYRQYL